jgi:hypothetical protein
MTSSSDDIIIMMSSQAARARNIHRRAAPEETIRFERKAGALNRHHRPVLQPWDVLRSEGVPQHAILPAKKALSLLSAFPTVCLSRACLGEVINFSMKWRERRKVQFFRTPRVGDPRRSISAGRPSPRAGTGGRPAIAKMSHRRRSLVLSFPHPMRQQENCQDRLGTNTSEKGASFPAHRWVELLRLMLCDMQMVVHEPCPLPDHCAT